MNWKGTMAEPVRAVESILDFVEAHRDAVDVVPVGEDPTKEKLGDATQTFG